jgi:DNA-binding beta-propeller fold protein YncE
MPDETRNSEQIPAQRAQSGSPPGEMVNKCDVVVAMTEEQDGVASDPRRESEVMSYADAGRPFHSVFGAISRRVSRSSVSHHRNQLAAAVLAGCMLVLLQGCGAPGSSPASASVTPSETPPPGAPTLTATPASYPTLGAPFEAVASSSGVVFVSTNANATSGSETGIQVFTPAGGGKLQPSCVNGLPSSLLSEGGALLDISFSPMEIDLAGALGSPGVIFFNVAALQACTATGVVVSQGPLASDEGSLAATVTPDGKYAFVANEYGVAPGATTRGNIGVVKLETDSNGDVTTGSTMIGQISTGGIAIAGILLSPDGTRVYATSEIAAAGTPASGGSNPILAHDGCVQGSGGSGSVNGLLTVIDVAEAEVNPGPSAVLATVDAGCSPVRMAESADESSLWVAARGDNRALDFSPSMLESNPDNSLLGYAPSGGAAPVGLCLFHNDELLAVANSNRFNTGVANLAILYVANPVSAGTIETVSTGVFPREVTVGADDSTLYLTDFGSDEIQVIETTVN